MKGVALDYLKRCFLLLALPWIVGATDSVVPVGVSVASEEERATAHMVKSIMEYTRWPSKPEVLNLCVVGQSRMAEGLPFAFLSNGVPIRRRQYVQMDAAAAKFCDALYLGRIEVDRARQWTALVRGAAVVTIAENDPRCVSEAMFCLLYGRRDISFNLNVDAVSRSGVRIDPRVLRMSRGG